MQGGPSHVDTFDYKPILEKRDGEQEVFDDASVGKDQRSCEASHLSISLEIQAAWRMRAVSFRAFPSHRETGR